MAVEKLKIGELAQRLGLNPRTIRFYEDAGVLPEPDRTAGRYRIYTGEDEERLRFIKAGQRLGFKLGEIKEILAFRDREQRPCAYVAELINARVAEVDERMRDLRTLKRELTGDDAHAAQCVADRRAQSRRATRSAARRDRKRLERPRR